jgi:hypothetical protein
MKKVSILNLHEDLLEDDRINHTSQTLKINRKVCISKPHSSTRPIPIETFTAEIARVLEINTQKLNEWGKDINAPLEVFKNILLTAKRFKLNPILGQISWGLNLDGSYQVYIPIDGWITLMHREPSFQGITFNQADETENRVPIWMECTIHRSDLMHPLMVREYYEELKSDHPIWAQMPCRMLRHQSLQQCVRLAFGIAVPEFRIPAMPSIGKKQVVTQKNQRRLDNKTLLKEKLNIK